MTLEKSELETAISESKDMVACSSYRQDKERSLTY